MLKRAGRFYEFLVDCDYCAVDDFVPLKIRIGSCPPGALIWWGKKSTPPRSATLLRQALTGALLCREDKLKSPTSAGFFFLSSNRHISSQTRMVPGNSVWPDTETTTMSALRAATAAVFRITRIPRTWKFHILSSRAQSTACAKF